MGKRKSKSYIKLLNKFSMLRKTLKKVKYDLNGKKKAKLSLFSFLLKEKKRKKKNLFTLWLKKKMKRTSKEGSFGILSNY